MAPEEFDPRTLDLARKVGVLCVSPERSYSDEVGMALDAFSPEPGAKAMLETASTVARLASDKIFDEATRPRQLIDRIRAAGRLTAGGTGGAISSFVFTDARPEAIELLAGISGGVLGVMFAHALMTRPFRGIREQLELLRLQEADMHRKANCQIIFNALLPQREPPLPGKLG